MDLTDTERYATAALFALALHSTHVETGVDRNGNSLSECDIAWGCPSEELFDEYLLSQVPLKLPNNLLDVFWGFDCMAPAGLAPRLFAWLKVPRKAWPGLLRMPDLAGSAGSPEAVEGFVALVRRYSAFLDADLNFTTGQADRLQQHFQLEAAMEEQQGAVADAGKGGNQQQQQQCSGQAEQPADQQQPGSPGSVGTPTAAAAATAAAAGANSNSNSNSLLQSLSFSLLASSGSRATAQDPEKAAAAAAEATMASLPAAEAISAAAASVTAAAVAASGGGAAERPGDSSTAAAAAGASKAADDGLADSAAASFAQQAEAVDSLPKEADEGTVVPAATFNPAEHYKHATSHKAVLALYEIIGGCLISNTEASMEPLMQVAAREAQHLAATSAAAAAAAKKVSSTSRTTTTATGGGGPAASNNSPKSYSSSSSERPAAAWFPSGNELDDDQTAASAATATSKQAAAKQDVKLGSAATSSQQQQQQQGLQGIAAVQWYDARARVTVKRVAHWLRVPWGQVRAFEQMWAAQAMSLDPEVKPKYSSSSRAVAYLKVGAAAVGGGALLAVTGGLAAPAIAAGLGAAVTLAHGGAAAAAAVAGFAGSTAGTAAMTGLFGAWGASVGGGSAGQLYGEVKELGFWDLSQSIYTDGKGPDKGHAVVDETMAAAAAAAAGGGQQPAASAGKEEASGGRAAGVGPSKPSQIFVADDFKDKHIGPKEHPCTTAEQRQQLQPQQPQPQPQQQQQGFLYKLFSSAKGTTPAAQQPSKQQQLWGASGSEQASSTTSTPRQQQQQHFGRTSRLQLSTHRQDSSDEDAELPNLRSKYIQLQEDAFNTDSEDDEAFQEHYLPQAQPAAHGGARAATPSAAAGGLSDQQQQQEQQHSPLRPQQQTGQSSLPPPHQQQQTQQEQQLNPSRNSSCSSSCSHESSRQRSPKAADAVAANAADGNAAHSLRAADTATPAAASAGQAPQAAPTDRVPSTPPAATPWGLFSRKAAAVPVYVPLLPSPVNARHHQADTRMALTIAANGCISCMEDFVEPWQHLPSRDCDRFALVWESACLKELGSAVGTFIAQQALQQVTQKTLQTFLYTGLVGALALPMTLSTAMRVAFGSKWLVALRRAQAAGKMLAVLLMQGCHGGRPVTLVGCSMGARLVFHCLLELARLGVRGCVENVILLGAPLSCRPDRWCAARSVVAGRLINGYSVNDWTLGLLYRVHSSSSIWLQAAGIWKVDVPGVENVNLSKLISGHTDYLTAMTDILEVINLQDS